MMLSPDIFKAANELSALNEEEAAECYFQEWFKHNIQPRAAALHMADGPVIIFEVIFQNEFDHVTSFYTSDDWKHSESIIFPDSECKMDCYLSKLLLTLHVYHFWYLFRWKQM